MRNDHGAEFWCGKYHELEQQLTAEREARKKTEAELYELKSSLQKPSSTSVNATSIELDKLREANSILREELKADEAALKLSAAPQPEGTSK